MQWRDKRVLVTGGAGFLGAFVVEKLRERGGQNIAAPRSKEYDLRDRDAIIRLYTEVQPHIVMHLAAVVGGIGANRMNPGRFFYDNAIMGIQSGDSSELASRLPCKGKSVRNRGVSQTMPFLVIPRSLLRGGFI